MRTKVQENCREWHLDADGLKMGEILAKCQLGATDLTVSAMCFGTNMFGSSIDQAKADDFLDCYVELGGNFIDTARCYGDWDPDRHIGASERAIGSWLSRRPARDMVVSTKGGLYDLRTTDRASRCTPAGIALDLSQSLDHLGFGTIDLYILHMDNPDSPVEPIITALLEHQDAGRIRHFAASNWAPERIVAANAFANCLGRTGFVASETFWGLALPNQPEARTQGYYHYYENAYEMLHANGLPILAYGAQNGGYFTKLQNGVVPPLLDARYGNSGTYKRFKIAEELAEAHGVSINDIALAYLICQPHQTIPIFGASRIEQIENSVRATSVTLTQAELDRLRNATSAHRH